MTGRTVVYALFFYYFCAYTSKTDTNQIIIILL